MSHHSAIPGSAFEELVGISSYANEHEGFSGIIKQRFSDFVVREISSNGVIARLNSIQCSEDMKNLEDKYFKLSSKGVDNIDEVLSALTALDKVVFRVSNAEIKAFLEQCINQTEDCAVSMVLCSCDDKAQRSSVHQIIKGSFAVSMMIYCMFIYGIIGSCRYDTMLLAVVDFR